MVTTDGNWKDNMAALKNLIFDFDGTIADTSKLIVATWQKVVEEYGLPYRNEESIKATIGVRLEEIPSILWPELTGLGETLGALYRKNFEKLKDKIPVELFPEVKETLGTLKEFGCRMAIATSRSHKSAEELSGQLGIRNYFSFIVGGDDVSKGKPSPESINKILLNMYWGKEESMMIGDMVVDIKMGKNAGIKTCGVTYGNGKKTELEEAGADFIIPHFSDLTDMVNL